MHEVITCHTFFTFIDNSGAGQPCTAANCEQLTDERLVFQAASGPTVNCFIILLTLLQRCYNVSAYA